MTTLREALQTIAVLHDGDRPCDCEGHEMARAVALAPFEREQARDRVIAAARAVVSTPMYEQPHVPRSEGGTGFVSVEFVGTLRRLLEALDADPKHEAAPLDVERLARAMYAGLEDSGHVQVAADHWSELLDHAESVRREYDCGKETVA